MKNIFKAQFLTLFLLMLAFTANAASYVLDLTVTNPGDNAEDVITRFAFPDCMEPERLAENMQWDPVARHLFVELGGMEPGELRRVNLDIQADSDECILSDLLTGEWVASEFKDFLPEYLPETPADKFDAQKPAGKLTITEKINELKDAEVPAIYIIVAVVVALLAFFSVRLIKYHGVHFYGLVLSKDGRAPVADCQVSLFKEGGQLVKRFTTNDEGRFKVHIVPGKYKIHAMRAGYKEYEDEMEVITKGGEVEKTIELEADTSSFEHKL